MAPPKRPWFRFYVEAVHDRKLRRLPPETRWLFVSCLAAARQSPFPGYLLITQDDPLEVADLVDFACLTSRQVETGMEALSAAGVIAWDDEFGCWWLPAWHERQFESDDSSERVAKARRDADRPLHRRYINADVTPDVTPPETEADTETENRTALVLVGLDFEQDFWLHYPRRNGARSGKQQAKKQWTRLGEQDRRSAVDVLAKYAQGTNGYPKDAERYLRDRLWEDWADWVPPVVATPAGRQGNRDRLAAMRGPHVGELG